MKTRSTKNKLAALVVGLILFFAAVGVLYGADSFQEGLRYYFRGELNEAVDLFRQAVGEQPDNARYFFFLGNTFSRLERSDDAEAAYERALEINPDYASARQRLAFLYLEQRRWQPAQQQFRRLLEAEPQNFEYRLNLGIVLFRVDEFDEARDELMRARELQPGDPEVHFYLGRIGIERQEYLGAVSRLQRAIELDPSEGRYYFYRGLARFFNEDYKSQSESDWMSSRDFRRAIDLNHDSPRARFMLANSLLNRGLYSIRENQLERGIDQLKNSVEEYRRVLAGDWQASNAYHNMGVAYLGIGNLALARRSVEEAISQEPTVPFFHDTLGHIYFRLGNFERALEAWELAVELDAGYEQNPFAELLDLRPLSARRREARIRK